MEDQVKVRLEKALAQLGREIGTLPDGTYNVKIVSGVVTVEGGTAQKAAPIRPSGDPVNTDKPKS